MAPQGACAGAGSWQDMWREKHTLELPIPDPVKGTQAGAVHEELLGEGGLVPWEEPHAGAGAEC